ncbi:MAG: glycosyltransferase family protein, partial [Longimicrobiales bacterium]
MLSQQCSRANGPVTEAPPRVSFFVHDLASNPIVRAYPIALAFQRLGWEVEVLGFRYDDQPVYAPYSRAFRYVTLPTRGAVRTVLRDARWLAQQATGDLVYGFKPLVTSYYPALLASGMGRQRPLLLDVEDDELVNRAQGLLQNLRRHVFGGWSHVDALKYRLLLHPFTRKAAAVTVSSSRLRARHPGVVLLHGPDESMYDPASFDARASRIAFGLPQDVPTALFAGVPHPHKGLRDVVDAVRN